MWIKRLKRMMRLESQTAGDTDVSQGEIVDDDVDMLDDDGQGVSLGPAGEMEQEDEDEETQIALDMMD